MKGWNTVTNVILNSSEVFVYWVGTVQTCECEVSLAANEYELRNRRGSRAKTFTIKHKVWGAYLMDSPGIQQRTGFDIQTIYHFQSQIVGIGFLKIHAPWNVLCREAEFMKLKMPTKKVINHQLICQVHIYSWLFYFALQVQRCLLRKIMFPFLFYIMKLFLSFTTHVWGLECDSADKLRMLFSWPALF